MTPSPYRHDDRPGTGIQTLIWLWPVLCALTVFALTRPGYLSFDSALMYWQARHDTYFDIGGPLLPWLWHQLLRIDTGTDAIRLCLMGLLATGLGACVWTWRAKLSRAGLLIAMGFAPLCPLLWMIWPHVWTDLLLAGLLLWLTACVSTTRAQDARASRVVVALLLAVAICLTRHNGWFALPPLLWLLAGTWSWSRGFARRAIVTAIVMLAVIASAAAWRATSAISRLDTWAVTLMWDLQAVSVATLPDDARPLIPASLTDPRLRVGELRAAFHPASATRLYAATTSGIANPTVAPLDDPQRRDLIAAWLRVLPSSAYWRHRVRVMAALWGPHRAPELRALAESPGITPYGDNPVLAEPAARGHGAFRTLIDRGTEWGLFAPGLHAALALVVLLARWRRLDGEARLTILALIASAACYALPLFVIAPSAETRYLLWPVLALWCAMLRALPSRASALSDASSTRR